MNEKIKLKFNIIIILVIILFSIATIPKTFQEDTFYMIKVGEHIFNNGAETIKDRVEAFTWHEGMNYTYPHWLIDVILYMIYITYDFFGIYMFTVIIGIIIHLLIYYMNIKIAKNNTISAIITVACIYLFKNYITARAQIITYICLVLEILFIERYLETGKKRNLFGLAAIPIVLANCHVALFPMYFVIYLPYIVEYIFSFFTMQEVYTRRVKRKSIKVLKLKEKNKEKKLEKENKALIKVEKQLEKIKQKENVKRNIRKVIVKKTDKVKILIIIFIMCIFAGLATPLGKTPYTYLIKTLQGSTMNYIAEHQAVVLIYSPIMLIIFALIIILIFSNKTKLTLKDVFMLSGMSLLCLISYKQFPIFIIGTMTIVNKMLYINFNENLKDKVKKIITKMLTLKGIIYTVLVISILFLLQYKNIVTQNYVDGNQYPVQATKWLKQKVNVYGIKLFNDFDYGSYLLFNDIPVFIDGRAELYDSVFSQKEDNIFIDYMSVVSLKEWYGDIFKKYEITHIITKKETNLNKYLQRDINYKSVYNDGTFSIYEVISL